MNLLPFVRLFLLHGCLQIVLDCNLLTSTSLIKLRTSQILSVRSSQISSRTRVDTLMRPDHIGWSIHISQSLFLWHDHHLVVILLPVANSAHRGRNPNQISLVCIKALLIRTQLSNSSRPFNYAVWQIAVFLWVEQPILVHWYLRFLRSIELHGHTSLNSSHILVHISTGKISIIVQNLIGLVVLSWSGSRHINSCLLQTDSVICQLRIIWVHQISVSFSLTLLSLKRGNLFSVCVKGVIILRLYLRSHYGCFKRMGAILTTSICSHILILLLNCRILILAKW